MSLVTLVAIHLGPWAAWVLPGLAIALGLLGGVGGVLAMWVRERRLDGDARTGLSPVDEGRRVRLAGRLRAEGDGVPSFVDGRQVALSSARSDARSAERRASALVVETEEGTFPLVGSFELRGLRARRAQVDGLGGCEILDARDGDTVLVEGFVGRVMQESLRDPAARLGLRSDRDGFFEPIRLLVRAPDHRRAALVVAGAALAAWLLLVPRPSSLYDGPTGPDEAVSEIIHLTLYGTEDEPTWLRAVATVARLLSPARDAELVTLERCREHRMRRHGSRVPRLEAGSTVVSPMPMRRLAAFTHRRVQAVAPAISARHEQLWREAIEARSTALAKERSYRGFDPEGMAKRTGEAWVGRPAPVGRTCGLSRAYERRELDDRARYVQSQLATR